MNALELTNVTKEYKKFRLDNLSLTLPGGCILGLIGENGAGKSTTIKLILDIIHRDSGHITVLGRDAVKESVLIKEDLGVVLDDNGLPAALNAKKIDRIMRCTYKKWDTDCFYGLLERLSVPTDKPFGEFSRGTKMKMGIAVALSHDPRLLLLDEATNGLDPVAREEVVDLLFEFTRNEENSVLISSHIVSDLEKLCDYIAFLHQGKLVLFEEKDRLFEQYGLVHLSQEELKALRKEAVIGKRVSEYGVEALVRRSEVSADMKLSPISIEELFIFMVKEA